MLLKHHKTLITGKPGVGKTTIIQKAVSRMGDVRAGGFYTSEIRVKGARLGFELRGLDGGRRTLARVDFDSRDRVSKYGVDTEGFEEFLGTLDLMHPDIELIVMDEIGKMELFSNLFRALVRKALDSDKDLLASIALEGEGFIRAVKERTGVHLFEITRSNREQLLEEIVSP
jgi:nucleoside-triphosphatase